MKALVGAFNQEKALVGAFSVIVQPVVEPMEYYTALILTLSNLWLGFFHVQPATAVRRESSTMTEESLNIIMICNKTILFVNILLYLFSISTVGVTTLF